MEAWLPAILAGIPLGLLAALIRWRGVPVLSTLITLYVSLFRATPSVTLILLVFYAAPSIGVQLAELPAAIVTLTLGTIPYTCEIWRAALLAFPQDQFDAALAAGMPRAMRFRLVVLPQIIRTALPGLVNEMTLLLKVTPAIGVIGLVEVTRAAVRVGAETYQPVPPFLVALAVYAAMIGCLVAWQRWLERRQDRAA